MKEEKERTNDAYLAGIFDIAGVVGIRKRKPNEKKGEINYIHGPMFNISSQNKSLINWIVLTFGGKLHVWKNSKNSKKGVIFGWVPTKDELMTILLRIYPFLHRKREQVECLIDFLNNCTKEHERDHECHFISTSPSEIELRESYYLQMKELKNNEI